MNGYIENAAPVTMARIRFDSAYDNNRPDRGEFFYAKCGCFQTADAHGVPLPEKKIDYQELSAYAEWAFTQRFSAFFNVPIRFLNPEVNANSSGLSDVSFGGKYAFVYNQNRIMSLRVNFQAPSGSTTSGLGNGNWWVEPGLLYLEQINQRWQVFGQFIFQAPIGTRSDFTGNMINYGVGTSYVVTQGSWGYVAPVVEMVGWTVLKRSGSWTPTPPYRSGVSRRDDCEREVRSSHRPRYSNVGHAIPNPFGPLYRLRSGTDGYGVVQGSLPARIPPSSSNRHVYFAHGHLVEDDREQNICSLDDVRTQGPGFFARLASYAVTIAKQSLAPPSMQPSGCSPFSSPLWPW